MTTMEVACDNAVRGAHGAVIQAVTAGGRPGRPPVHGVADPDATGPLGQPTPGEFGQRRRYVDTEGLDGQAAFGTPGRHRLHQQPVGTADVQERPVAGDPLGDVPKVIRRTWSGGRSVRIG